MWLLLEFFPTVITPGLRSALQLHEVKVISNHYIKKIVS